MTRYSIYCYYNTESSELVFQACLPHNALERFGRQIRCGIPAWRTIRQPSISIRLTMPRIFIALAHYMSEAATLRRILFG
jgi:hypothetical protein